MKKTIDERDRNLISGFFLEDFLPSDKIWLKKYFKTSIQKRFLIYFLIFESHFYFVRHTGIYCSERYLNNMGKKISELQKAHEYAKNNFDLEKLADIEMGKFKV